MGAPKGNRNAAKGKTRLDVHISLSGKRRAFFERLAGTPDGKPPTDAQVIAQARTRINAMLDALIEVGTRKS